MNAKYIELQNKCEQSIEHFKRDLSRIRTGRAQSGMLDTLNVEYYGSHVPIRQLALINVPEPRVLTVQVYDSGAVVAVEKAIQTSDLGLNPSRDGNLLRVVIPSLTAERRKEMVKSLHKLAEDAKVAIRSHRREEIDVLKSKEKSKVLSQDDLFKGQEEVQKISDKFTGKIDELLAQKEKEVLEV
jgi:ribosome recycling factor